MKTRLFFILLFPIYCNAQISVISAVSSNNKHSTPEETVVNPSPLFAEPTTDTKANLAWSKVYGATTYTLQRDVVSNFTSPTTIYTGSNLTYNDSGLSPETTYYYRVKDDVNNSYVVCENPCVTYKTHTLWYEGSGIQNGVDTEYADMGTTFTINTWNSINPVGPTLNPSAVNLVLANKINHESYPYVSTNVNVQNLSSQLNLTGDFTIMTDFAIMATPVNHYLTANTAGTQYIRFQSLSVLQTHWGNITFTETLVVGRFYKIVIKRVGTTLYCSVNGGVSYGTKTGATGTFTIDHLFATNTGGSPINGRVKRFVVSSSDLPDAYITRVFNYLHFSDYTLSNNTSAPTLPTGYTSVSLPYINLSSEFTDAGLTGGTSWKRIIEYDGGYFFIISKNAASPTYHDELLYYYKNGKLYDPQTLGHYTTSTDGHNVSSLLLADNTLFTFRHDVHYDGANQTSLKIRTIGSDFDTRLIQEYQLAKGVASGTANMHQYASPVEINGKLYLVLQEWGASFAQWITIFISSDRGRTWEKYRVSTTDGVKWYYGSLWYDPLGEELILHLNKLTNGSPDAYTDAYVLKSPIGANCGMVWENVGETWSQDIRNDNVISNATLTTNALLKTASTDKSVKVWHLGKNTNGEFYGVIGNGSDTGLQFFKWNGSSWDFKDIDPGSRTLVLNAVNTDGENTPFAVYQGGTTYNVYCFVANSGNWQIAKYVTVDDGDTWDGGTIISTNNSIKHSRMVPIANIDASTKNVFMATAAASPNKLFLYEEDKAAGVFSNVSTTQTGKNISVTFDTNLADDNQPPSIYNVTLSGGTTKTDTLFATVEGFESPGGYPEGTHAYQWYRSTGPQSDGVAITNDTLSYHIETDDDVIKYLRCGVRARQIGGMNPLGEEVTSVYSAQIHDNVFNPFTDITWHVAHRKEDATDLSGVGWVNLGTGNNSTKNGSDPIPTYVAGQGVDFESSNNEELVLYNPSPQLSFPITIIIRGKFESFNAAWGYLLSLNASQIVEQRTSGAMYLSGGNCSYTASLNKWTTFYMVLSGSANTSKFQVNWGTVKTDVAASTTSVGTSDGRIGANAAGTSNRADILISHIFIKGGSELSGTEKTNVESWFNTNAPHDP